MAFLRKKKIDGHQYFYWVEGYVEDGQQKQRVLAYLGKGEEAIARAYAENLPESVIQKIRDSFISPGTYYIILKFSPDGTKENYYRDNWSDDFMQRH